MKVRSTCFATVHVASLLFLTAFGVTSAHGATWTETAEGSFAWNVDSNPPWDTGVFPNAPGAVANLELDILGNQTINLGDQPITVGTLSLGDLDSSHRFVISSSGGALTFDNNGSNATLTRTAAGATGIYAISAPIELTDNLVFTHAGSSAHANDRVELTGAITGPGSLTKMGPGSLRIGNSANTFAGGMYIVEGVVHPLHGNVFGTGPIVMAGGTLEVIANSTFNNPIVAQASTTSTLHGTSSANFLGAVLGSGTITNVGDVGGAQNLIRFDGSLAGFSGVFHINSDATTDRFRFFAQVEGANDASNARFVLDGATHVTKLALVRTTDGVTFKMGELSGTGGRIEDDLATGQSMTLEVGHLNTDSSWAGVFRGRGDEGRTTNFTKVGSGTLDLNGDNTYNGVTNVNAGTLRVNGTHTSDAASPSSFPGAYSVAAGATLGGSGVIDAEVNIAPGAFLAPGTTIESLGVTSANIAGALQIDFNGDNDTIDLLNVTTSLDITEATLNLSNLGSSSLAPGSYVFATYGELLGEAFASVTGVPSGFTIDYDFMGNQIALVAGGQAGDFNGDGNVDGADFVIWQTNFPNNSGLATLGMGDANGDGNVDGADFVVWQTNFPTTAGSVTPVPEPQTFGLMLLGAAVSLRWGLRRRPVSDRNV